MRKAICFPSAAVTFLWLLAGCTNTASSTPKPLAAGSRPNILLIVADDLGYTDLGAFGSEIQTPNLDRLARTGTILTNYYTAPLCAPTRAMLLSGTDHHLAGEGLMGMPVEDAPGYEGYLNHRVVSLATRLHAAGYHTYMSGKWHLGDEEDQSPTARGFEHSFTLLDGGATHFADMGGPLSGHAKYRDEGKRIDALPKNFYSTIYYTDKMLGYLKQSAGDNKPFFAYLAYTSPHWPIQAPDEDMAKQRGRYDEGYEVLRQRRFAASQAKGLVPRNAELPNLPPDYKAWNALSAEEKAKSARTMEVYAAMIERMDSEIGRVLKYLEESGQLKNTLIMFESDNGAEGAQLGGANADNRLENIGHMGSFAFIGPGWAAAASGPYSLRKYYAAEGGIRVPAIVNAPALGVPAGRDDSILIASDVAPTFLELAGVDPKAVTRSDALPITGRSFAGVLRGDNRRNRRGAGDALGWEHSGQAAIRKGDWKLLWIGDSTMMGGAAPGPGPAGAAGPGRPPAGAAPGQPPGPPSFTNLPPPQPGAVAGPGAGPGMALGAPMPRQRFENGGPPGDPTGRGGPWKLFNLRNDPAELHDVSQQHPEVMAQMLAEWNRYVAENGVLVKKGVESK